MLLSNEIIMIHVYFIKNTFTNNYKIGKTKNLDKRLKQLQTGCDSQLIIYKYIETINFKTETHIHNYFKKYKILGEWYNITSNDIDKIIELIDGSHNYEKLSMKDLRLVAKINNIKANLRKDQIIELLESKSLNKEELNNDSWCIIC